MFSRHLSPLDSRWHVNLSLVWFIMVQRPCSNVSSSPRRRSIPHALGDVWYAKWQPGVYKGGLSGWYWHAELQWIWRRHFGWYFGSTVESYSVRHSRRLTSILTAIRSSPCDSQVNFILMTNHSGFNNIAGTDSEIGRWSPCTIRVVFLLVLL